MPTASLRQILDELAAQLVSFYTDSNPPIQIEPRFVGQPSPPTIDMFPGDIGRDPQTAGMDDLAGGYLLTVRARVQTADNEANQDILVAFLDDEDDLCLAHAVLDEPTLNGLASDTDLQSVTGFLLDPGTGLIGVQWTFLVIPGES